MIIFWILAVTMMAMAVALILPPLLGHGRHGTVSREAVNLAIFEERVAALEQDEGDAAQREQIRHEMERELIQDLPEETAGGQPRRRGNRITAVAVVMAVPMLSTLVYTQLGSSQALHGVAPLRATATNQTLPADHPAVGDQKTVPSLDKMVEDLAARLKREPANLEGWIMLGRSYMVMERYPQARDAFAQAYKLAPDNTEAISRYAEASALAQGGDLSGKPLELVAKLLALEPDHPNGLWLSGLAAYKRQDYREAVERWSRLAAMIGSGPNSDTLAQYLSEARAQLGETVPETADDSRTVNARRADTRPEAPADTSGTPHALSVHVSLAPELADKASPDDTVFIFARAAQGPRMPLAIVQRTVAELPVSVTLDDSMAMTPAMKLSNFSKVVIGARISKSGNAMPQTGDLEGSSQPMSENRNGAVNVTIDRVI